MPLNVNHAIDTFADLIKIYNSFLISISWLPSAILMEYTLQYDGYRYYLFRIFFFESSKDINVLPCNKTPISISNIHLLYHF